MFLARGHHPLGLCHFILTRTAPTLSEPSVSVQCSAAARACLALPCPGCHRIGPVVIHVLSMHPSLSALLMPPRASNYLSRPNCLSVLSPADVKVSRRCEPARAQPCYLSLPSPPPPLPADAAH